LLNQFQQLNGVMQGNSYQTYLDRLSTMKREGANPRPLFQPPAGAGRLPEITDQASYDKLPKGAQYTHDGQTLTKQ